MKYQHILNGELLFETDDATEYYSYLIKSENYQLMYSTLFNLLEKSNGYIANMANK